MPNRQWHPQFVISLKETLSDALPGEVEIIPELALSSKPLDVDVVVVKKTETARLRHPLARIFKAFNLFEFKSPDDRLEPNDFDMGLARNTSCRVPTPLKVKPRRGNCSLFLTGPQKNTRLIIGI